MAGPRSNRDDVEDQRRSTRLFLVIAVAVVLAGGLLVLFGLPMLAEQLEPGMGMKPGVCLHGHVFPADLFAAFPEDFLDRIRTHLAYHAEIQVFASFNDVIPNEDTRRVDMTIPWQLRLIGVAIVAGIPY